MKKTIIAGLSVVSLGVSAYAPKNDNFSFEAGYEELNLDQVEHTQYDLEAKIRTRWPAYLYRFNASQSQLNQFDVNRIEAGLVMQPRFGHRQVLMFRGELGGYALTTSMDDSETEYKTYMGAGFTGIVYNDLFRVHGDYRNYRGDIFESIYGGNSVIEFGVEWRMTENFSVTVSKGSFGEFDTLGVKAKGSF